MGDNITPPQQAFNWIADLYSSTEEIKANGQTIVGLLHEDIGHLGIFVSGQVAQEGARADRRGAEGDPAAAAGPLRHGHRGERAGATATVEYDVTLVERTLEDLRKLQKYDRVDERPFEAVAALSELTERAYELLGAADRAPDDARVAREDAARLPSAARAALGDVRQEPVRWPRLRRWRRCVQANRQPRGDDNALVPLEALWSDAIAASLDLYRDLRDAAAEATVLPGLRQPAVAERGRPAARDPAGNAVRSAHRCRR